MSAEKDAGFPYWLLPAGEVQEGTPLEPITDKPARRVWDTINHRWADPAELARPFFWRKL